MPSRERLQTRYCTNVPFVLMNCRKIPFSLEKPISLENVQLELLEQTKAPRFQSRDSMKNILRRPRRYTFFYGLYSWHGRHYPPFAPPYCPIPDINWREVRYNNPVRLYLLAWLLVLVSPWAQILKRILRRSKRIVP
jgi:hypothetical protein